MGDLVEDVDEVEGLNCQRKKGDYPVQRISQQQIEDVENNISLLTTVDLGKVRLQAKPEKNEITLEMQKSKKMFEHLAPEASNTVVKAKSDIMARNEQIEAVMDIIQMTLQNRAPRGLVLNPKVSSSVDPPSSHGQDGLKKVQDVLGKGNSAGEVVIVTDRKSGEKSALKTVMITQFNKDEIRAWIHLGDKKMAPELYRFELQDNKIYYTMEIMTGEDFQKVLDERMSSLKDQSFRASFSLCILHDLLNIWDSLYQKGFVHGDMHAGNVRLEHTMDVKLFDFGRAKNFLEEQVQDPKRLLMNDIVGIIRIFTILYSGFDFNDHYDALRILKAKNLIELDIFMKHIPEEQRKEMYSIMNLLFDSVRDPNQAKFGDLSGANQYVHSLIHGDISEIKKKAASIIFPELFRNLDECDSAVTDMPLESKTGNPIWDECSNHFISNEDVQSLAAFKLT